MTLNRDRPEILTPPQHPPACCTQQTITAGPEVAEKTRQKHDYPSAAWRQSYKRRTAAERLNATIKDTATTSIGRGWTRLTGLTPLMLSLACLTAVRNQRILTAYTARQDDHARRAATRQPPTTRSRRRRELAAAAPAPPWPTPATAPPQRPTSHPRQQQAPATLHAARPQHPARAATPGTTRRPRKPQQPRPHQRSQPDCQTQM